MSCFHFSHNLFLETQELRRFQAFLGEQGLDALTRRLTGQAGLLLGADASGWRVSTDNLSLRTLAIAEGWGVDERGRVLHLPAQAGVTIPLAATWYWLRVSYRTSSLEAGFCTVSADGTVTGVETEFTRILRGQPNFSSKLRFYAADGLPAPLNGGQEHEVLDIEDDATLRLQTAGLQNEAGLRYAVVGTFLPGFAPDPDDKFPFRYDDARLEVVRELDGVTGAPPPLATGQTTGDTFYLARVKRDQTGLFVEDKRNQLWLTTAQLEARALPTAVNPLAGVERVTFDTATSARDRNLATLAWGLTITGWSFDPAQLALTCTAAAGGRYLAVGDAAAGDFDGWNLYLAGDPEPLRILATTKPSPTAVVLTLAQADPTRFAAAAGQPLAVVPAVETVLVRALPLAAQDVAVYDFEFPARAARGRFALPVTGSIQKYRFALAYRNGQRQTGYRALAGSAYYAEENFNADGTFAAGLVPQRTIVTGDTLTLAQAPDSLKRFRDQTTTGDLFGVETRLIETATPVLAFEVGTHRQYEICQTALNAGLPEPLTLTQDHYLNLKGTAAGSAPLRPGNHFTLHLRGALTLDGHQLRLVKDYVNPSTTGTLLKEFATEDVLAMARPEGLLLSAVWDGTSWVVYTFRPGGGGDLGEIKHLGRRPGFDPLSQFDAATGLGLGSGRYAGWAMCDGRNGTEDLRGRVIVGYDPTAAASPPDSTNQRTQSGQLVVNTGAIGNLGGEHQHALSTAELPKHDHTPDGPDATSPTRYNRILKDNSGITRLAETSGSGTSLGVDISNNTYLRAVGENLSHENRMPYLVLLPVQRIA